MCFFNVLFYNKKIRAFFGKEQRRCGVKNSIEVFLYKTLTQRDYKSAEIYLLFKKVYKIIGILILSLLLTPFVPYIITTERSLVL